ncbi:MAG: hypothetical protein MR765_02265 [Tenericutes bacterium]|nr:hypothetical protein [Mycoplasmatota bacterium]
MKREELIKLKKMYNQELERRTRINQLLKEDNVLEYLKLNGINLERMQIEDTWSIIKELLKNIEITETNSILVHTSNYMLECKMCYEENDYYRITVPFDDNKTEYQTFRNIETGKIYTSCSDDYVKNEFDNNNYSYYFPNKNESNITLSEFCHKFYNRVLTSELRKKYTILNPYNSSKNQNSYEEVRKDFFETAITKGQTSAKKLILSKYPLMK